MAEFLLEIKFLFRISAHKSLIYLNKIFKKIKNGYLLTELKPWFLNLMNVFFKFFLFSQKYLDF